MKVTDLILDDGQWNHDLIKNNLEMKLLLVFELVLVLTPTLWFDILMTKGCIPSKVDITLLWTS